MAAQMHSLCPLTWAQLQRQKGNYRLLIFEELRFNNVSIQELIIANSVPYSRVGDLMILIYIIYNKDIFQRIVLSKS